jgi:hypothetical protein
MSDGQRLRSAILAATSRKLMIGKEKRKMRRLTRHDALNPLPMA